MVFQIHKTIHKVKTAVFLHMVIEKLLFVSVEMIKGKTWACAAKWIMFTSLCFPKQQILISRQCLLKPLEMKGQPAVTNPSRPVYPATHTHTQTRSSALSGNQVEGPSKRHEPNHQSYRFIISNQDVGLMFCDLFTPSEF